MSYIGNRPDTNILYYALGIDRFNGTGSQTAFTLSRELGQDLDAQVIVDNVIQEPGSSFAYSISGTTLTFTEAPPTGTNNIQVIFRTQNVVSPYTDITPEQIGFQSITEDKVAPSAITATKIGTGAVTETKIGTGAVTTNKIADSAVTDTKIGTGAVTNDKIGTGAVTSSKIGNGAVGTNQLASSISVNITGGSISGITDLGVADGGTGASSAAGARTNLGVGSLGTQESTSVSITGGSISGITDLAVADGGTGASDAATARTNLGVGSLGTQSSSSVNITGGSISGITDLSVADGGTGSSSAAGARTNLGLGTIATQAASSVAITGGYAYLDNLELKQSGYILHNGGGNRGLKIWSGKYEMTTGSGAETYDALPELETHLFWADATYPTYIRVVAAGTYVTSAGVATRFYKDVSTLLIWNGTAYASAYDINNGNFGADAAFTPGATGYTGAARLINAGFFSYPILRLYNKTNAAAGSSTRFVWHVECNTFGF